MPTKAAMPIDIFDRERQRLDREYAQGKITIDEYRRNIAAVEKRRFQLLQLFSQERAARIMPEQVQGRELVEPIRAFPPTLPSEIAARNEGQGSARELGFGLSLAETERFGPENTGPTGAETLRRKLSERTVAPGNVGSPTGATAFQGAEERFEFGPSPLLQAGRERGRAEAAEEDPTQAFRASLGRGPGEETTEASTGQKIGLVLAAIGDALTAFGTGKNPQTVTQILERFEQAQAQREERARKDQLFKLDLFKFSRQLDQDDFLRYEKSLDLALKAAKENPAMDETTKNRFIEGTLQGVPPQFRDAATAQLQGLFSSPNVSGLASDVLPLLDPAESKIFLSSVAAIHRQDPAKVADFVKAKLGEKVAPLFRQHALAAVKSLTGKQGMTFQDVVTLLGNTPEIGPAMARYWNEVATPAQKEEIQDAAAQAGMQPIGVAKKKAEKEALRPGEVETAREIELAKLEEQKKFKEPSTLQERIAALQESQNPDDQAKAERLLAISDQMRQSITINLPKTPATEFITAAQDVRLASIRLARTAEKFDPGFVGLIGKTKGILTRFADIPGIPVFKERKEFANDLIAMTNDVKKRLLGAARTIPELEDVARFLPDPDLNLSVAEFVGNLETFMQQYLDVMEVLPPTLKEAGFKEFDFTKDRERLEKALETMRKAGARGMGGSDLQRRAQEELRRRGRAR